MKVYIPFNSNDFNSVFTTLSISPRSFYPNRNYSFKRSSISLMNENENFLIGYEKPILHNKKFDKDYGYPVLIEIYLETLEQDFIIDKLGTKYVIIDSTVFLFDNFKLIFRSENELSETFAKSLKSIETKFANLAKSNSSIISKDCISDEYPKPIFPVKNLRLNSETFQNERKLNRIFGIILGNVISCSNSTSKEWQNISISLRMLNNSLSLYTNKVGEDNKFEKEQSFDIINDISKTYEDISKLEEIIILESTLNSELLQIIKEARIFDTPLFKVIVEGLLTSSNINLPLPLILEKLRRVINLKHNSKSSKYYIDKVNTAFLEVKRKIEHEINLSKKSNEFTNNFSIKKDANDGKIEVNISGNLKNKETEYLEKALYFFIHNDNISNIEVFFTNRKDILINLANHFKLNIEGFDKSLEREYLINLLKSFDSLRNSFNINNTDNETLKSIAILFTSGRDLLKFIENNERAEIQDSLIYYTLWGAVYGAAIFPKTMTESITENNIVLQNLISIFKSTYKNLSVIPMEVKQSKINKEFDVINTVDAEVIDKSSKIEREKSKLAKRVLKHIEENDKTKLSDLMKLSNSFKKNSDIEKLIENELKDEVKTEKKGRTMFAIKI